MGVFSSRPFADGCGVSSVDVTKLGQESPTTAQKKKEEETASKEEESNTPAASPTPSVKSEKDPVLDLTVRAHGGDGTMGLYALRSHGCCAALWLDSTKMQRMAKMRPMLR